MITKKSLCFFLYACCMLSFAASSIIPPLYAQSVPAFQFVLNSVDGKKISLADFKGKVVFLDFWASWCPPCLREMPSMERLRAKMEARGLVIVALTRSPGLALLTIIATNLVQNVENTLIVPRVLGESVGLHPVVMMVMLVVGAEVAGLPGLVLAPILTAVLRDVYRYFNYRFADTPREPEEALDLTLGRGEFKLDL